MAIALLQVLDIPLKGDQEVFPKDVTFPPAKLYEDSRFSIVFESDVSGEDGHYAAFLTEKVLKPLYRGHPFLHLCGCRGALRLLRAFGFRPFTPPIDDSASYSDAGSSGGERMYGGPCSVNNLDLKAITKEVSPHGGGVQQGWGRSSWMGAFIMVRTFIMD